MGNTESSRYKKIKPSLAGRLAWEESGKGVTITTFEKKEDVTATRWLIVVFVMALIQTGTIFGIIISWAYNLLVSRTLILISILEIGVLISAIILIILFFQFKEWSNGMKVDQSAYPAMVAYIGIEIASLVAVTAEFITRLALRIQCNNGNGGTDCGINPTLTVSTVMLTLNALSLATTVIAIATLFVLYSKLKIYSVVKPKTEEEISEIFKSNQLFGARTEAGTYERATANAYQQRDYGMGYMGNLHQRQMYSQ